MNKSFWDEMVSIWCKASKNIDSDSIEQIAQMHAEFDGGNTSGYAINPLDDDDDEEEW